jgi:hypothetical protein
MTFVDFYDPRVHGKVPGHTVDAMRLAEPELKMGFSDHVRNIRTERGSTQTTQATNGIIDTTAATAAVKPAETLQEKAEAAEAAYIVAAETLEAAIAEDQAKKIAADPTNSQTKTKVQTKRKEKEVTLEQFLDVTPPVKRTDTNDGTDNKTRLRTERADLREANRNKDIEYKQNDESADESVDESANSIEEFKKNQALAKAFAERNAEIDAVAQQSTQNNEVFTESTDADVETISSNVSEKPAQERNENEAKQVSEIDEKGVAAPQEGMKEDATTEGTNSFMPSVVNVKLEDPLHVCGTCGGYSTANGAPSVKNVVVTEEPSKIEEIGEIDEIDEIDEAATSTPRVDAPSLRTDEPNIEEELDWL